LNKKALGAALIGLGLLFVSLGLYQANQYMISQSTASAALKSYDQLAQLSPDYAEQAQVQKAQTAASLAEATGALVQAVFIDFALGIVVVMAGLFIYPDK